MKTVFPKRIRGKCVAGLVHHTGKVPGCLDTIWVAEGFILMVKMGNTVSAGSILLLLLPGGTLRLT